MAKNKVVFGNTTIMDITDTTAEASDVASGEVFYNRAGERTVGTGNYMNKVSNPTADDILITDANGQAVDSGVQLSAKQDTLISGTNIKTINNQSLLGSGDIAIDTMFIATYNTTDFSELASAISSGKSILVKNINNSNLLFDMVVNMSSLGTSGINLKGIVYDQSTVYKVSVTVTTSNVWSNTFEEVLTVATDDDYGLMKTNSAENITLTAEGRLNVGGRLGQFPSTTGVYSPKTISPASVGNGSLLLTEASGTKLGNKSLAVSTGTNITLKQTASAGTTQYVVSNTYQNRIICAGAVGGIIALNEVTSATDYVNIVSVQINGSNYVPDSSTDSSTNNIIITTNESINPSESISSIRVYSNQGSGFSNLFVGQAVGGVGGASVVVGQKVYIASGNACALVGADIYNGGNGNAVFGRQHISRKNRWFMAGTGHDNTYGITEGGAVFGKYASISTDTLFAIGNGTSHTARSNAFEIKTNGDIYKNGVKVL